MRPLLVIYSRDCLQVRIMRIVFRRTLNNQLSMLGVTGCACSTYCCSSRLEIFSYRKMPCKQVGELDLYLKYPYF